MTESEQELFREISVKAGKAEAKLTAVTDDRNVMKGHLKAVVSEAQDQGLLAQTLGTCACSFCKARIYIRDNRL